jgi:hypothetical protein
MRKREPEQSEAGEAPSEQVRVTPGLIVLGIVAVLLGVFSALVMSATAL